ncbi:MAG: TonB C-terminal domain-containing protein [Myxococcales bacterium]|nr:TonB C-terminal domain-containing protein [Myxococcales bacterium]
MHFHAKDARPPSLLDHGGLNGSALLAGAAAVLFAHVLVPLGGAVLFGLLSLVGVLGPDDVAEVPKEIARPVEVVEVKFVKLGRPLPKRKLPNKEVPSITKAPQTPSSAPNPNRDPVPKPEEEAPEVEADADALLAQLGTSVDALNRDAVARDVEGDPDGIEEGTASRDEGDLYAGQLYTFFRRGWTVPTTVPDAELSGLQCKVIFEITADGRVGGFRIEKGSGNETFDDSVRTRMGQAEGSKLPEVPESAKDRYLGRSVSLTFLGRHARR